jgi:hypothetical protein
MGLFRRSAARTGEQREPSGGWYADPYGTASRRWYDEVEGWTDRVQGEGQEPDKTGVGRVDDAMQAANRSADPQAAGPG